MPRQRQWIDTEDEQAGANRQTSSLAGLVVALLVVVVGLFLIQSLRRTTKLEDCLLAGRTNCEVIATEKMN